MTALLLVGTCNIHVMYSFRHAYCMLACQPQCSTSGGCRIFERVVLNYVMCAKRERARSFLRGGPTLTSGVKFHTFLAFSDGESSKTVLLLKVVYLAVNKTKYCIECAH